MKLDPNAPAFPTPPPTLSPNDEFMYADPGITIRGHLAGLAMQAYIGHLAVTGQTVSKCHAEIADESCRIADALIVTLNATPAKPAPVEPVPALQPALPPNFPASPEGTALYGRGPLPHAPSGIEEMNHVFGINMHVPGEGWAKQCIGNSSENYYALRRGTAIARANGIPDQP